MNYTLHLEVTTEQMIFSTKNSNAVYKLKEYKLGQFQNGNIANKQESNRIGSHLLTLSITAIKRSMPPKCNVGSWHTRSSSMMVVNLVKESCDEPSTISTLWTSATKGEIGTITYVRTMAITLLSYKVS